METYAKSMSHTLAYQEGAGVFATGETDAEFVLTDIVAAGKGISGGLELLIKKNSGKWNGWLAGTLSRTVYRFPLLNGGQPFFPVQDRRFDLTLVSNYRLNTHTRLSAVWFFTSGNVLAAPIGVTKVQDWQYPKYSELISIYGNRNAYRAAPFHRLDITLSRSKQKKHFLQTWEFGLYNAYFRKNPLYYHIGLDNKDPSGTRLSLKRVYLLPIVPYLSYNFTF